MRHERTYHYIDFLSDIVANYNNSPHRSLNDLAPNQVNEDNEADVWACIYLKKKPRMEYKPKYSFEKSDLVRISIS